MTATPIPRTLALTVYGDLDVSVIDGRPPGRQPVETWVVRPAARGARVLRARARRSSRAGHQAFVVYPLVEESDKLGLRDAIDGRDRWARALPEHRVGLLHGRMKRDEKEAAMTRLPGRATSTLLVATVVVEVGVDVPNATVLVVEHAERFGLSQLHQLRGRIGRGTAGGLCVLVDRSKEETPARGSRCSRRPTTASRSPRRTSSSAAPATSSAPASTAWRASGPRGCRATSPCSVTPAARPPRCSTPIRASRRPPTRVLADLVARRRRQAERTESGG